MYIFGILEDSTGLFVLSKIYNLLTESFIQSYGFPFGYNPSLTLLTEPIYFAIFFFFSNFLDPIYTFNIFNIITILFTFFISFKFYNYLLKNKYISLALSIFTIINPYMIYHIRSHPQLIQIWSVYLLFYYLVKYKLFIVFKAKNYIILGLLVSFNFLISNYLGFFSYILYFYLFLTHQVINLYYKNYKNILVSIKYFILSIAVSLAVLFIFLFPYFKNLYQQNNSINISDNSIQTPFNRPIEDFITFSSRPWYFIIPPVDNIFFGNISSSIINYLQNEWGNYLTKNYFKSEHSSLYLGIINIIISFFGLYYLYKNRINIQANTIILLSSIPFLIFFTLPPIIVINNFSIYSISYIIWVFFPMFRVLSRLGIIIFILNLILVGFGYKYLFSTLKKPFFYFMFSVLILITLSELYVPLKFTYVGNVPNSIKYLSDNLKENDAIATYPYDKTNYVFFWQRDHKKNVINPKGYYNVSNNFDSNEFTDKLITCNGIINSINLGMTHIINFDLTEKFFENQMFLTMVYIGEDVEISKKSNNFIKYETANIGAKFKIYKVNNFLSKEEIIESCKEMD